MTFPVTRGKVWLISGALNLIHGFLAHSHPLGAQFDIR